MDKRRRRAEMAFENDEMLVSAVTPSMKLSDRQGFETSMGHYFFEDSN